ncbi:MAG TPA: SRPBCC family protein [Amnibacterium sp.]|uniref:SRPBCC family protein n=1 Tax=Amnibacterium sp. TaxID=1872496 RepID=UPI002F93B614
MPVASLHLTVLIDRPADAVYRYASDPANLPAWAAGLASGIREERGRWFADSPMGDVEVAFVGTNELGVLDHQVVLPDGTAVLNPLRVLSYGDGAEVVFTLRREAGVDDAAFDADVEAVRADLATLKRILESPPRDPDTDADRES